jgi:N-methylhydantoinase A
LNADYREDLTRMFVRPLAETKPDALLKVFTTMESEARQTLSDNGIDTSSLGLQYFADMRYVGQEHTVRVPIAANDLHNGTMEALRQRFNTLHEKAYAHMLPEKAVEMVRLRLAALVITSKPEMPRLPDGVAQNAYKGQRTVYFTGQDSGVACPVYDRPRMTAGLRLDSPLIVEEWTSTTLVLPGQWVEVDAYGNLIISHHEQNEVNDVG